MRVLWLTFIPSPYRLRFFEELGKSCDLTVLFERKSSKNRKEHWNDFSFNGYKGTVLRGITIGGYDKFCPGVIKYLLADDYDVIVISNPTSPTGIYSAAILQAKKIPYIVESDGAFPAHSSGIKLALKKFVMSNADLCFSTASLHDEYYMECGVKKENIRRYPFTSIGLTDIDEAIRIKKKGKDHYKAKLDLKEDYIILSVGRFSYENGYGKGFDILLRIAEKCTQKNVGFYIVGDDPTKEFVSLKETKGLGHVHFVGYREKEKLAEYYAAADIFVLLTRGDIWGLVINEAMMFGLPIITTNKCIAGLEMVDNGVNGYIVSLNNEAEILKAVNVLLDDEHLREKMACENLTKAREYTFENMADTHMAIFDYVEKM